MYIAPQIASYGYIFLQYVNKLAFVHTNVVCEFSCFIRYIYIYTVNLMFLSYNIPTSLYKEMVVQSGKPLPVSHATTLTHSLIHYSVCTKFVCLCYRKKQQLVIYFKHIIPIYRQLLITSFKHHAQNTQIILKT